MNTLSLESLLRLNFAGDLLVIAWYVVVTALFYGRFPVVSRPLSVLTASFTTIGCALQAVACFFDLAPLAVLHGGRYLGLVEPVRVVAHYFVRLHSQTYAAGVACLVAYCLLLAYVVTVHPQRVN